MTLPQESAGAANNIDVASESVAADIAEPGIRRPDSEFLEAIGAVVGLADIRHSDARALAESLGRDVLPYAHLVECRVGELLDVLVLDVEVDLVQHPVYDIRHVERLAVVFAANGSASMAPDVLVLREDFPADVPHLNLRSVTYPKSLCLYDVPFRDVRSQWTPARFVALIRQWLCLTARGELHADDQPLEPLLTDSVGWVVLPHTIRAAAIQAAESGEPVPAIQLAFQGRPEHLGRPVLVATPLDNGATPATGEWVAALVHVRPRVHGVIRRAPRTLVDLQAMLLADGDDLLGALRASLATWDRSAALLRSKVALIVLVPKRRSVAGAVEGVEAWAFFTDHTLATLGSALGVWELQDGAVGMLLSPDTTRDGSDVKTELASVYFGLSRDDAARHNGRPGADDRQIVAIGGGALGSQVMLNAARGAFGRWTVIDDDLLLPHNIARHGLPGDAVAFPKADSLPVVANDLIEGGAVHSGIVADVLAPGAKREPVAAALRGADAIVDLSASVTVARALALDVDAPARRVSLFLNPSGTDLTLLAEDTGRAVRLDALEMQYYRAVASDERLRGALASAPARHRYGRSCRDVSVVLSQSLVAMHAGLGTRALEQILAAPDAQIRAWRVDGATLAVASVSIVPAAVRMCAAEGWTVVTDDALLHRLAVLRAEKLPNETGGVLIGAHDLARRIIYVVDTVPSPRDSREYPTSYMRGCDGLEAAVRRIEEAAAGQLHYVGEWHSHPAGHSCLPSEDDKTLFEWLTSALVGDGLPPLMLIVGDGGLAVPYVERMVRDGRHPAELRPTST